ncbi:MAG: DoxX family protein [Elusimicrobia bacterium]|nr:DoxX family protein [Elusimicrobiota bacterium]
MRYVVPIGRICYSLIFLLAGPKHFQSGLAAYAAAAGVPLAKVAVPAAGVFCILGGLSILLGYRARRGAWLIVLFLVPVTLFMHRFWGLSDAQAAAMQQVNFLKNLSMLGAALMITRLGSGPCSLRD